MKNNKEIYSVIFFFPSSVSKIGQCSFERIDQCLKFIQLLDQGRPQFTIGIINNITGEIQEEYKVKKEQVFILEKCFNEIFKPKLK